MGEIPGSRVRFGVMVPNLEVIVVAVRPPVEVSSMSSSRTRLGLVAAPCTLPATGVGLLGVVGVRKRRW